MKRLPGYTLLNSGRWRTPNGGTITEGQYVNHVARYQGYKDYRDFLSASSTERYEHFADVEVRGAEGTTQPYEVDSEFAQAYANARNDDFTTSPHGAFADLLVYLGLRDDSDDWDVGETGEV